MGSSVTEMFCIVISAKLKKANPEWSAQNFSPFLGSFHLHTPFVSTAKDMSLPEAQSENVSSAHTHFLRKTGLGENVFSGWKSQWLEMLWPRWWMRLLQSTEMSIIKIRNSLGKARHIPWELPVLPCTQTGKMYNFPFTHSGGLWVTQECSK